MNNHAEYIDRIDARAFKRSQQRQAMCEYLFILFSIGFAVVLVWGVFATKHIN